MVYFLYIDKNIIYIQGYFDEEERVKEKKKSFQDKTKVDKWKQYRELDKVKRCEIKSTM